MIEQQIINYLHALSDGFVNIKPEHARHIIDLVQRKIDRQESFVLLKRFDAVSNNYILIRTIKTTLEAINAQILIALEKGPQHGFYLFECFNVHNEMQGKIWTDNPNIFFI